MTKKTKEKLRVFLNKLLEESNVDKYEFIDFEDGDINFFVTPKLRGTTIPTETKFQFILYCSEYSVITLYCPIIYKLGVKDSIIYTLNTINNVNNKIAVGKIYMSNNDMTVSYINRIIFNDLTTELTPNLLSQYIEAYLYCAMEFYTQMKVVKDNE